MDDGDDQGARTPTTYRRYTFSIATCHPPAYVSSYPPPPTEWMNDWTSTHRLTTDQSNRSDKNNI